jgi:hypothetical protein
MDAETKTDTKQDERKQRKINIGRKRGKEFQT